MATVYILHSDKLNKFYIGSCQDLNVRLNQHRNKEYKNSFTTKADDWKVYFSVDDLTYDQARQIETHIKNMKSSIYIRNLKKYPEIIEKLKVKYGAGSPR